MLNRRGFTLLEVIVAISILAVLSLFTVQAIQNALKAKAKVQKDIDKSSELRDALRIMERDINMAFNHRDPSIDLYNMSMKAKYEAEKAEFNRQGQNNQNNQGGNNQGGNQNQNQNQNRTPPQEPKYKQKKRWTQFIGEPEELNLTTLSNIRLTEDAPISSQAEVGYKIKSCRRRSTQEQSSKCLWRRVSNFIHEDITKVGEETVLLENVTEFKLRYLGPKHEEEWLDTWITNEKGDDTTKDKFPYAVEITLEMKDPNPAAKDKKLRMTMVASIRNPNNEVKKEGVDANGNPLPPDQLNQQNQQNQNNQNGNNQQGGG